VTAAWAGKHVGLHFIAPSQPWRNGYVESFNSRVRDECNINTFWSVTQARVVITDWKHDYNHNHRRHSALGYLPSARYAAICTHR
jgi:transposase InsO family protein